MRVNTRAALMLVGVADGWKVELILAEGHMSVAMTAQLAEVETE